MRQLDPVDEAAGTNSLPLYSLSGDLGLVRTTNEVPRRVSILDLIRSVTGNKNPKDTWARLQALYPAVVAYADHCQFPGERQRPTPVTNARGIVTIVNLLPGQRAAEFRAHGADVLVRYLGGDPSLVDEIHANRSAQESARGDAPERIFGEAVEGLRSATGVLVWDEPQVYLGLPSGSFSNLRPVGNPVPAGIDLKEVFILKTGCQLTPGRIQSHGSTYGGFQLLESCVTRACTKVEQEWKAEMRAQGRLLRGKHTNKDAEDVELLWVKDMDDYQRNVMPFWNKLVARAAIGAHAAEQVTCGDVRSKLPVKRADSGGLEAWTCLSMTYICTCTLSFFDM